MENTWRKCTTCKKPIAFNSSYLLCSVSSCNTKRASMVFCEVKCWDAHLPVMRHREAFYSQKKSPLSFAEEQRLEEREKLSKKSETESKPNPNTSSNKIIVRKKST
jgi:hypothetical protein